MTRIERRLKVWQRRLHLTDWIISVEINPDKSWKNMAEVGPVPGRKEAVLTVAADLTAAELEYSLVHELTHLLLWPLNTLADAWEAALPAKSRPTHTQQWNEATEQVVDALARLYVAEPPRPVEKP